MDFEKKNASTPYGELFRSIGGLVNAELQLLETKAIHHLGISANQILLGLFVFGIGLLGIGALLLSLILVLGKALQERYWLSALLVGISLLSVPLPLTIRRFKRMKEDRDDH